MQTRSFAKLLSRRTILSAASSFFAGAVARSWADPIAFQTPAHAIEPQPATIQLVNGAAAAGLDFTLRNGATGRKYQVETLPGGLGVIDFDNDGWPDLFCTNGATLPSMTKSGPEFWNRLYRNNRDGTFTDVTVKAGLQGKGYSMGVAVADYNNDGFEDIFVAGVHGNCLFRNNGDGTFKDVTAQAGLAGSGSMGRAAWSVAACWIDYDNDGFLDLVISNYCDWEPGIDPVCGGIDPGLRAYCHPDQYKAEPMQLFHNNGDGTFTEITRKQGLPDLLGKGMGIAMADYAADGHPGVFIANDNARNLLLRMNGKSLQETGLEAGVAYNEDGRNISGMGADFGDIDGDGWPDIVMTGLKNETYDVFLNQRDSTFEDGGAKTGLLSLSRGFSGWGCGLMDLDNDGWLDLFVAAGGLDTQDGQANRVFKNNGGRFADVSASSGPGASPPLLHRGVVFADFDRDGRIDVAVTALNAPLELWWNRSPRETPARHWLQLKLSGTTSNRSAIGARVELKAGGRSQSRTVNSSVGYSSSSDLTLHFGLGEAVSANLLIHWPSGIIQKLNEIKVDQRLMIVEPEKSS